MKYSTGYRFKKGINEDVIRDISRIKNEPKWMLDFRIRSYEIFKSKEMPQWGADLSGIDLNSISYYSGDPEDQKNNWKDVPLSVKTTFDKLGIPKAEMEYLAGVKAQFDSEVIYGSLLKEISDKGVIFMSTDEALKKHEDLFREYFSKAIPPSDNKFAALNSAAWSGGTFVYIPKGISLSKPLQAYFRINAKKIGQFERTLIIADEGSFGQYIEGCSAPIYTDYSLHAGVVEVFVRKNSRFRYTTIQNWHQNIYNLVTKRAFVYRDAVMEWVDGNIGSKATMKYPSAYLLEEGAKAEVVSLAYANNGQHQDVGTKIFHLASNTSSNVVSKSVSKGSGRSSYRGLIKISRNSMNCKAKVVCDALLVDKNSRTDTYPKMMISNQTAKATHEASVSKIEESQLFYLMSRGLSKEEASVMLVNGFVEPIVRELPMEYAIELNRLIQIEMEDSNG